MVSNQTLNGKRNKKQMSITHDDSEGDESLTPEQTRTDVI